MVIWVIWKRRLNWKFCKTLRRQEGDNTMVLHKNLEEGLFKFRLLEIFYRTWGKTRNYSWKDNISRLQIYGVTVTEVLLIREMLRNVTKNLS